MPPNDRNERSEQAFCSSPTKPTLGVILLDAGYPNAEAICAPDDAGMTTLPVGFLDNPATWQTRTIFRVAQGCDATVSADASDRAGEAVLWAAQALEGRIDFLTSDCAWMWFRRHDLTEIRTPKLISSLALLDLARTIGETVAIVVQSEPTLRRLLNPIPAGVRIISLEHASEWRRFLEYTPDLRPPLDPDVMGGQIVDAIAADIRVRGAPDVMLLECTAMPQFRSRIRAVFGGPLLDQAGVIRYLLDI